VTWSSSGLAHAPVYGEDRELSGLLMPDGVAASGRHCAVAFRVDGRACRLDAQDDPVSGVCRRERERMEDRLAPRGPAASVMIGAIAFTSCARHAIRTRSGGAGA